MCTHTENKSLWQFEELFLYILPTYRTPRKHPKKRRGQVVHKQIYCESLPQAPLMSVGTWDVLCSGTHCSKLQWTGFLKIMSVRSLLFFLVYSYLPSEGLVSPHMTLQTTSHHGQSVCSVPGSTLACSCSAHHLNTHGVLSSLPAHFTLSQLVF